MDAMNFTKHEAEGYQTGHDLLTIQNLKTYFFTRRGVVRAVDGIDLSVDKGETLGLVGESGCGKTVTGLSILRLIPVPGRIVSGHIYFEGDDLLRKNEEEMRRIRGNKISMIFQDPMTSLNPVFTVGEQIAETIGVHQHLDKPEAKREAIEMLKLVGIPEAEKRVKEYPHQFSGGMRQRAMIAMALSCRPSLLIADEPTTALDVTVQAQILELMNSLRKMFDTSIIMISHNLGVIAEFCDNVAIVYAGNIIEHADSEALFEDPKHPYTWGLMHSIPTPDVEVEKLHVIEGNVPNLINPPSGCKFHPRCPQAKDICREQSPPNVRIERRHAVNCFLYAS